MEATTARKATKAPTPKATAFKNERKASDQCVAFIASWESFSPVPYKCSAGVWTIGFGHAMPRGIDRTLISQQGARALLAQDIAKFEAGINELVKVELSQHEFDALVALTFNIGLGVADGIKGDFADSTLLAKLNAGDRAGAAAEFDKWVYAAGKKLGGLIRRRAAERVMFSTNEYHNNV